jgi:transposase, IS30 family
VGRPGALRSVQREFWRLIAEGVATDDAGIRVGVDAATARRWFGHSGGMAPLELAEPSGRYLSLGEREEIALARAAGAGVRQIARQIGRDPATVSRELRRNRPADGRRDSLYRATLAQSKADSRARRPKESKLARLPRLQAVVQDLLEHQKMSPEQISGRLPVLFADDPEMRISHEAIYQALYVQGRGALRRDLVRCLRTGRALRRPRRRVDRRRQRIKDMVMISDRPAEVADRAVPGHWEGDLIIGAHGSSAIGTLVERATRFTMLLHLPDGHGAEQVNAAIVAAMSGLPDQLRRSLTWDQGAEMARHLQLRVDADLDVYFCDPHSPWQRGTNENTNGLLRQYFPKGTNLSRHSQDHLDAVAAELNARPRKVHGFYTPTEVLTRVMYEQAPVATTP